MSELICRPSVPDGELATASKSGRLTQTAHSPLPKERRYLTAVIVQAGGWKPPLLGQQPFPRTSAPVHSSSIDSSSKTASLVGHGCPTPRSTSSSCRMVRRLAVFLRGFRWKSTCASALVRMTNDYSEFLRRQMGMPPRQASSLIPPPAPLAVSPLLSNVGNPSSQPASAPSGSLSSTSPAIEVLNNAIVQVEKIAAQGKLRGAECAQFFARVKRALSPVFGEKSAIILNLGVWMKEFPKVKDPAQPFQEHLLEIKHFASFLESVAGKASFVSTSQPSRFPNTNRVFIIHGHDELNWHRLDRILRADFGLDPTIILAEAGQSQVTMQKFENAASVCAYAFAIFTPDDMVTVQATAESCQQARPNVIFETGWFIGRLGAERVALVVKKGTKLHSDFDGVNRIDFKDNISDAVLQIKRELEKAGMSPPKVA